jgi:hypothetical protein
MACCILEAGWHTRKNTSTTSWHAKDVECYSTRGAELGTPISSESGLEDLWCTMERQGCLTYGWSDANVWKRWWTNTKTLRFLEMFSPLTCNTLHSLWLHYSCVYKMGCVWLWKYVNELRCCERKTPLPLYSLRTGLQVAHYYCIDNSVTITISGQLVLHLSCRPIRTCPDLLSYDVTPMAAAWLQWQLKVLKLSQWCGDNL